MQTPSNKTKRNGSQSASPTTSTAPLAKPRLHRETITPGADSFLTAAELRARWRVSGMFLWRMRSKGKLGAYIIGARGVRFLLAEIEQIEQDAKTTGKGVAQ